MSSGLVLARRQALPDWLVRMWDSGYDDDEGWTLEADEGADLVEAIKRGKLLHAEAFEAGSTRRYERLVSAPLTLPKAKRSSDGNPRPFLSVLSEEELADLREWSESRK